MTVTIREQVTTKREHETRAAIALTAAILGFFVVTLDAVVVNVALPSIRTGLGGGIVGLQWVVDGYTLLFRGVALVLRLTRRPHRRAPGVRCGYGAFVAASIACGAAPSLGLLVAARFVQGAAAAVIMPASLTLISQAYPDTRKRARAVAIWALGGSVASTSGPVIGGLLTLLDWRLIFFINLPAGAVALLALRRTAPSPQYPVPVDWFGQVTAVAAIGALTYGAIGAGSVGLVAPRVLAAFGLAGVCLVAFLVAQARGAHPMVPLDMFGSRTFRIALGTGFAFMVGHYGLPLVFSLYLQGERGLNSFGTGIAFLPMMLIGMALTPFSARIVERVGARPAITVDLAAMTVGLAGPLTMPPMTAVLLNHLPAQRTGIASGVFNTSRQLGGALAVGVFGALLANGDFMSGLRSSLLIAAVVLLATTLASLRLQALVTVGKQ